MPAYNLVTERRNDLTSLQKILDKSSKIKILINQTTENLNSIDAEGLARFAVFLPEKIDVIRFANNIQHIGQNNGVVLEKIKVLEPSSGVQDETMVNDDTQQAYISALLLENKIQQTQMANTRTSAGTVSTGKRYATTKATFEFIATYEKFQLLLNDLEKSLGLVNVTLLNFTLLPEVVDTKKIKIPMAPLYQFTVAIETYSLI